MTREQSARRYPKKCGPDGEYTPEDFALFARYREARAVCRPKKCTGSDNCWVDVGPPGLGSMCRCAVCLGVPPDRENLAYRAAKADRAQEIAEAKEAIESRIRLAQIGVKRRSRGHP